MREVILPSIAKNVGYVPIPRIEYTDNMVDVVVEVRCLVTSSPLAIADPNSQNLTLESENVRSLPFSPPAALTADLALAALAQHHRDRGA